MVDDSVEQRIERLDKVVDGWSASTFEELVAKLGDESEDVRLTVASRLRNLDDPRAVPALIGLMEDTSGRVRGMAAIGLWYYEATEARDVLVAHLVEDKSRNVRAMCVRALGAIGGADELVIAALDDPDDHVRISSVVALNRLGKANASGKLLDMLGDPEWSVRYFACCALLDFGVGDRRIVDALAALRELPEAREAVVGYAEADVMMPAFEKFVDELEELGGDVSAEEMLDALRERHGESEVPFPVADPLGDMIARARELCDSV